MIRMFWRLGAVGALVLIIGLSASYGQQPIDFYKSQADQGNPGAQMALGMMYAKGMGVPRDDTQAVVWLRKAAEQGLASAQFGLGNMYAEGRAVPQNDVEAVAWYRKAAEQGDIQAENQLGGMYAAGRGVPRDSEQAEYWNRKAKDSKGHMDMKYRAAAEGGDTDAQNMLGTLYSSGMGVPKDEVQARLWFGMAAGQGSAVAQYDLGKMYTEGRGGPKDAQTAIAWYRKAAELGHGQARGQLRKMYIEGQFMPTLDKEAGEWWRKLVAQANAESTAFSEDLAAANGGDSDAQVKVGRYYLMGIGVAKSREHAADWFTKAAGRGNPVGQCLQSALNAADGGWRFTDQNTLAVEYCLKAANAGNTDAEVILAVHYGMGRGVPKNAAEANTWWRKAADQGRADAESRVASMYKMGEDVPKDEAKAIEWEAKAAEQYYSPALMQLSMGLSIAKMRGERVQMPASINQDDLLNLAQEYAYDAERDFLKNLWASPENQARERQSPRTIGNIIRQQMDKAGVDPKNPWVVDPTKPINDPR